MKRTLILSLIVCGATAAFCPSLHAQDDAAPAPVTTGTTATTGTDAGGHHGHRGGGPGGGGAAGRLARLTTELSLTADQQASIKPILDDQSTKMAAVFADTTLSQDDRRPKMKAISDAANAQISALLTDDQKAKFADLQQKIQQRRQARGGNGGGAPATTGS